MQATVPLSGTTPWDVATTVVRQVHANEMSRRWCMGRRPRSWLYPG